MAAECKVADVEYPEHVRDILTLICTLMASGRAMLYHASYICQPAFNRAAAVLANR